MEIRESGLTFSFGTADCVKFDETQFYRKYFNALPGGKGVDVIHADTEALLLLEIKNCSGHERENQWRIACDNQKVHTSVNTEDRDSLDVEVSKKVAMTIACLLGAHSKKNDCEAANALHPFSNRLMDERISTNHRKLLVVLFLEGQFVFRTRTKKMIMKSIADSINRKLHWLNCAVSVVDSATYPHQKFELC